MLHIYKNMGFTSIKGKGFTDPYVISSGSKVRCQYYHDLDLDVKKLLYILVPCLYM